MIRLDNVTCGYGGSPVLSRVSLSVAEGETVMITGPNGVGKSTLLRVLAGSLVPSKGDVDYGWPEGRDPRHLRVPSGLHMYLPILEGEPA